MQTSSAAVERVFSSESGFSNASKNNQLQDYDKASVMFRFSKQWTQQFSTQCSIAIDHE